MNVAFKEFRYLDYVRDVNAAAKILRRYVSTTSAQQ
jgi:hypothetical protein